MYEIHSFSACDMIIISILGSVHAPFIFLLHTHTLTHTQMSNSNTLEDRMYGKADVRLLHVRHDTRYQHVVHELRCRVLMRLASDIDFVTGDNRDIIATDTTKNTVYALAKKVSLYEKPPPTVSPKQTTQTQIK